MQIDGLFGLFCVWKIYGKNIGQMAGRKQEEKKDRWKAFLDRNGRQNTSNLWFKWEKPLVFIWIYKCFEINQKWIKIWKT